MCSAGEKERVGNITKRETEKLCEPYKNIRVFQNKTILETVQFANCCERCYYTSTSTEKQQLIC